MSKWNKQVKIPNGEDSHNFKARSKDKHVRKKIVVDAIQILPYLHSIIFAFPVSWYLQ